MVAAKLASIKEQDKDCIGFYAIKQIFANSKAHEKIYPKIKFMRYIADLFDNPMVVSQCNIKNQTLKIKGLEQ